MPVVFVQSAFMREMPAYELDTLRMMYAAPSPPAAAGTAVALKPGSYHVMLMGLTKTILPGTKVDIKLAFKGAKAVALKLTAKSVPAGAETYSPTPMPTPSKCRRCSKTPSSGPTRCRVLRTARS